MHTIDALILNRNLKNVTDILVSKLKSSDYISFCGVIDAGSRVDQISEFTVVSEQSTFTRDHGLRPNRGFEIGIDWWLQQDNTADWLLLLPNDSEIANFEIDKLLNIVSGLTQVVAIIPISPDNPYKEMLSRNRFSLGWNSHEGPILLKKSYLINRKEKFGYVFDSNNFRGYLSFIELALQIYANNYSMGFTDLVSFSENKEYLLEKFELIGTEPLNKNQELLINEGENWLGQKYGLEDRWTFELIVKLLFDEFFSVNPSLSELKLI